MSNNEGGQQQQRGFNFSEVFWQKTAMLFLFYWIFCWLMPSLLPVSLQTADFKMQMIVCGAGGLVFALLSALGRAASQGKPGDQK